MKKQITLLAISLFLLVAACSKLGGPVGPPCQPPAVCQVHVLD